METTFLLDNRQPGTDLSDREALLRTLIDVSTDAVVVVDHNGRLRYANPAHERLTGYTDTEIVGQSFVELIHPDDRPLAAEQFAALVRNPQQTIALETRVLHRDGSVRYVEASGKALPNGDFAGYLRDVTEHRRATAALHESDTNFRILAEISVDGIVIVRPDTILDYANASYLRVLGYAYDEVVGHSFIPFVHPDDLDDVQAKIAQLLQNLEQSTTAELRVRHKDGSWHILEGVGKLMPNGNTVAYVRDISDRKEADEQLHASEEQFRSLIENSSDGIAIFDRQGTVRYVSPGLTRIVGWEAPELLGQTWHALAHPDDLTPTRAMFHQVFEHPGQAIVHESRFRHKDGSWRLLEVVGKLHPNGHVVANSRDITERKLAEEQLRDSEERFRAFVEVSPIGIVLVNAEGAIRYASPAYARFSGYEAEDLVGQSFLSLVHPDEISRVASLFADVLRHPDRIIVAEYQHLHKDGVIRIAEATGKVLPNGDIVGFVRDITEHKQLEEQLRESEAYYRTILENATDGISLTDANGVFTYVNPAYAQMLGYEPQELIGQPYLPLLHPDEVHDSVRAFAEAIANPGRRLPRVEARLCRKDGSWCVIETTGGFLGNGIVASSRDITERKRTEEALRLAERRFRAMFDQPLLSVQVFATDGRVLQWNEAYAQLWDVNTPEHIQQLQHYNVLDDQALVPFDVTALAEKILTGEAASIPPTYYRPQAHGGQGRARWVQGFVYPVKDDAGMVQEVITLTQDITAQKEAEDQLRHLNEALEQRVAERTAQLEAAFAERSRLAEILEATSDMVGFTTLDGQALYINRAGRRMIGVPADLDVTALNFADIYPPDVLEVFATVAIPTAMRDGTWSGEVTVRHWDGHVIPVSIVGIIHFGPDGAPTHLSAIIRDITERKRAEVELQQALAESKRLAAILEATTDYVGIADVQGAMVYVNRAGRRMLGIPAEADIRQFKIADQLAPPWHEIAFNQIIPMLMEEGKWQGEAELHHLDGYPISVSNVSVALHAADGSVEYLAAINRDISEQKRAEAELKKAKEAADAAREAADLANKAKSTFLANMSHEIRTPMNAVIGMTSLLLNTSLDDKQRDFVETIRTSGDALLTIINDILDFSKIEAGKLDLERQPLDLRSCIESALDLLAPKAVEKGIDLAYEFGDEVPGGIVGDVTRLRQILVNLIGNAIKFTERGEVVVSVRTESGPGTLSPQSSVLITFSVRDTGIGIAPDKLDRLFQSFSQLDASTTREYGGTGLGLAISKRLAELMGGMMWAESAGDGQGATFHFTIRTEAAPAPVRVHLRSRQPLLAGKRLLVVDDHPTNRRILSLQAQTWGMECVTAASPEAALAVLRQGQRFDLAVLDMHMPEMDGAALAAAMCAEHVRQGQHFPLILLTSLGYETRPELEAVECFAAYLTKPVKPSQLYDVLISLLAGADPAAQHLPPRAPATASMPTQLATQLPLRILLAEDVAVNQKFALLALEDLGYSADVAANGREVLAALQRQMYDVILMDVQMPEMDGLEATRCIRREFGTERQPHIIAMTANAMQGDRELCLEAGMDDYVSKPVYLDELRAALERVGQRAEVLEPALLDQAMVAQVLRQRMGHQLIALYVAEAEQLLVELASAITLADLAGAQRVAHGLKSSSRYVGARRMAELSEQLEALARDGALAQAPPMAKELQRVFERTRDQLLGQSRRQ